MSTFQKLLHRFLGQIDDCYTTNLDATYPKEGSLRSESHKGSVTKAFQSRRQRSLEVLKTASCFSCGIEEPDQQFSNSKSDTLTSVTGKNDYTAKDKSIANRSVDRPSSVQQQILQKRKAKTKLVIVRHGERVDALFGDAWFEQAFDQAGNYHRFHSNLPMTLPYRQNFKDYLFDPPLTELGLIRSYRTGTNTTIAKSSLFLFNLVQLFIFRRGSDSYWTTHRLLLLIAFITLYSNSRCDSRRNETAYPHTYPDRTRSV